MTGQAKLFLTVIAAVAMSLLGVVTLGVRNRQPAPAPAVPPAAAVAGAAPVVPPPAVRAPEAAPKPSPQPQDAVAAREAAPYLDESALMDRLREIGETAPPLTLQLAREGNRRFPDSPQAPERAWMIAKSLVNMQRFAEARDEARIMVQRYRGTSWALDVERHLLTNPLDQ